jgi:Fe-S-cluster containining protein
MTRTLTVLDAGDPCRGCGACCTHVGTPPGFAFFYPRKPQDTARCRSLAWGEDPAHHDSAPPEAREILATYYAAVASGTIEDRTRHAAPCLWYDPGARRCRWHAHRPEVCREFEPGEGSCLAARDRLGIATG